VADSERGRVLRFDRLDVVIALGLAGLVNLAMLAVAARLFHTRRGCPP
jgi:manganese transport protein